VPALEKLNIDTPEQVALEFSLATIGSRFLAVAIDTIIQIACAIVLLMVVAAGIWATGALGLAARPWVLAVLVIGGFVIYYGYFAVFETVWNGQTPGKRVIGLRVIHASGRPISAWEAILRNVVRLVDQMPAIYAIGIVSVFVTERSQRLGDLAAGTVVVHERLAESLDDVAPQRRVARSAHGARRLAPEEISVIELFFSRRGQLDGYARMRTAHQIARRVRERLEINAQLDDEQLLEDVVAEYRSLHG
jgi:uncharacterized RDD family membrane protein YckC